jgi:long-subunit fatty acid transport protein
MGKQNRTLPNPPKKQLDKFTKITKIKNRKRRFIMNMLIITVIILISQWKDYLPNSFGSISGSLGGSPVAFYDGVEYGAYNPAALTGNDKFSASIDYHFVSGEGYFFEDSKYSTSEHFLDFVGFVLPLPKKFYFGVFFSIPYNLRNSYKYAWETDFIFPGWEDSTYYEYNIVNRFYSFTPSLGFLINDHFSVGLSLSRLIKKEEETRREYSGEYSMYDYDTKYNYGIETCLGVQYREDAFSLGFLIEKGYTKAHHRKYPASFFTDTGVIYYDTTVSIEGGEATPLVISGGISKCFVDKFTLNFSVDYLGWKRMTYEPNDSTSYTPDNVKDMLSVHVGGEYRLNKNIALRMGAYNLPYTIIPNYSYPFDDVWSVGDKDQLFLTFGISIIKEPISFNFSFATSELLAKENSALKENQFSTSITFR